MKKLSILICSLENRKQPLEKLLKNLEKQRTDEVEILTEIDNGEMTVGAKRQKLLERSVSDYLSFVDDDDDVASDYILELLKAIADDPDCVGLEGVWTIHKTIRYIYWGLEYDWKRIGRNYYIGTNHITPVRREIALEAGFPDKSSGEDQEYGRRVRKIAKKEIKINKKLYFYNCDPLHSAIVEAKKRHGK